MTWNLKENNRENNLFKSYYCSSCKQTKPCYILSQEYCCACAYQLQEQNSADYLTYEKTLEIRKKEKDQHFKDLKIYQQTANKNWLDWQKWYKRWWRLGGHVLPFM